MVDSRGLNAVGYALKRGNRTAQGQAHLSAENMLNYLFSTDGLIG